MIILDTNVVSAIMRPVDNAAVVDWLDRQRIDLVWTSSITLMEIRYGIFRMAQGQRRSRVAQAFDEFAEALSGRMLVFDLEAAEQTAQLMAHAHARGHNMDVPDSQIAGIVAARKATLATRNVRHFRDLGITLVDPWTD